MIASFASQTVTVQRPTKTTDSRDRTVYDWSDPDEHDLENCILQPMVGPETFDASGQQVISRWHFRSSDGDLLDDDRLSYAGEVYEIDGKVQHWPSPSGRLDHMSATLKRVQ